MEFELVLAPSDDSINEIRNGLVEHNSQYLNGIERNKIAYYITESGKKVAGVTADIFGSWLLINFLWVDKELRGSGVGSELMAKLEAYAKSQGCTFSLVDTFSFQAKPFYEKLGYECQMTLEQYPVSHARHYLTKKMA